ncbi:hypothetical protein IFM89_035895 [Coptis chinensis]|uniref:Mediator of RNA polymerase II transcription subunit 16 n=1 Tax=Coptis chinensis TaxID=261450 RepID=A0A835H2R5_9MAGN|nr:hypothetical protein IFM89_035895 [Coptis chinensis]
MDTASLPPPPPPQVETQEEEKEIIEKKSDEDEDDLMEESCVPLASVFEIKIKQPKSNSLYKMNVPHLCRKFSSTAWCAKLNAIACASETCARIPSSNGRPPFWIPIHIVNPERPTECADFNVIADSPRDSVQFIEWSPTSCPRALLIGNFHGRITIWTQPSNGPANLVRDLSCWQCEHEWRQDIAVVTKWLSVISPATVTGLLCLKLLNLFNGPTYTTKHAWWPNFLCVCSVFSSGCVQLHWAEWPLSHSGSASKWFSTSKGLLGAGPSGIMAADAIITEAGTMHVAGVPIVNPSTVVVWEITPGPDNGFQGTAMINTSTEVPPSLDPPRWTGYAPLAAYLFSWQESFGSKGNQAKKQTDFESSETVSLRCSPVSNFSAYVSPEATAQSAVTTTWGSGVTTIAFDPTQGGSVISVVIVEGQYMSPYDPNEGPSITGWRVQCWESSVQPIVLHPIFRNPASSVEEKTPMQTVWVTRVDRSIQPMNEWECSQEAASVSVSFDNPNTPLVGKAKRLSFYPLDLPSDVRTLARIVYSQQGEVAVSFLNGGVHIFSGASFAPVGNYHGNVVSAIAAPTFSSSGCCLASVWHDTSKDCTSLKITRVLPPALPNSEFKANSATWERAIADRGLLEIQSLLECIKSDGKSESVRYRRLGKSQMNVRETVLSTFENRNDLQSLDRIKCRLLEGRSAQEVRALVLDMQDRLLLDMLGKGIESALINPGTLVSEPWLASGEMLSGIDADVMTIEPQLFSSIQAYSDVVVDLASHFTICLRRFCRTLASPAAGTGSERNMRAHSGSTSLNESSQVSACLQGAIGKITSTTDGVSSLASNPMSPSTFTPISINTGTFPGIPAVRLVGDCHFLHRLCQLLYFCYIFWRRQMPRHTGGAHRYPDSNMQKPQPVAPGKAEEPNTASTRAGPGLVKSEEVQASRAELGAKVAEGPKNRAQRLGSGNAGHGYTYEEVKVLFLILMELCTRTTDLAHPFPASQVGGNNIQIHLHYIDGNYTVFQEVVEASLLPYIQFFVAGGGPCLGVLVGDGSGGVWIGGDGLITVLNYFKVGIAAFLYLNWSMNMPRPRGADAAGMLLRELELHPPAEEWHKHNMFGGPWSDTECDLLDDTLRPSSSDLFDLGLLKDYDGYDGPQGLWPRKRRLSEREAAFGLKTSVGLGAYLGIMGSRRDVLTATWKTGLEGVWYKCIRCLRETSAFASPVVANHSNQNDRVAWWISRWSYSCPMCGGTWVKVV